MQSPWSVRFIAKGRASLGIAEKLSRPARRGRAGNCLEADGVDHEAGRNGNAEPGDGMREVLRHAKPHVAHHAHGVIELIENEQQSFHGGDH